MTKNTQQSNPLPGLEVVTDGHNVTDATLAKFQAHYQGKPITKDDVFHYLYGVLHAPDFRRIYNHELREEAARVPQAPDFWAFANAGKKLMDIHLGYETCDEYPLRVAKPGAGNNLDVADCTPRDERTISPDEWHLTARMKRIYENANDKTNRRLAGIRISPRLALIGIPPEANRYTIAGDQPIECAIKALVFNTSKTSDPNDMFEGQPPDAIRHYLQRLVRMSIDTAGIIDGLPPSLAEHIE